jgi:hypothetical protein
VLRRIFVPKTDEIIGGWRETHNEELHNLCSSPNITRMIKSRRMRRARHVARVGEKRNVYMVLVGKPEAARPLGRLILRWEDNIKTESTSTRNNIESLKSEVLLHVEN